jgi:Tol biopolymer transport system component
MDFETGKERMLTADPSRANYPQLSADGKQVAYILLGQSGGLELYTIPFSGGASRKAAEVAVPHDWTADGRRVLIQTGDDPARLEWVDLDTGERTIVAQHSRKDIYSGRVAPGGGWISFGTLAADQTGEQFIAPLRQRVAPSESEWIPSRGGRWSPDGSRMWGVFGQDGFQCIWAQRLDPRAKRMIGELEPVYHFHSARRSLANVAHPGRVGLSVAADKVVFALGELTGNVWMAQPEQR